MISTYHTFRHVASTLDSRLAGSHLTEMYSQERDELVLSFDRGKEYLVVSCTPSANTCYLHPGLKRAKKNSADIMPECWGTRVDSVTMHPSDRIITIRLFRGKPGVGFSLVAQFFGARSNVLLLDGELNIINAFKRRKELEGSKYVEAGNDSIPDLALMRARLTAGGESEPVAAVLKEVFPALGATLVREALFRADIESRRRTKDLSATEYERLLRAITSALEELNSPQPRLYTAKDGTPSLFSLIPLQHAADLHERRFEDVHEAIRHFISRRAATSGLADRKKILLAALRKENAKALRTRSAIEEDLRTANRADEYERLGSWLMANLDLVSRGAQNIRLPDGSTVALEPGMTPAGNAQRYFEKAKRARTARQQAHERLASIEQRLGRVMPLLSALESADTQEALQEVMREYGDELGRFGLGTKQAPRPPFRTFTVDGGFEVWAGKSSANNDLLTLKHARPNDLWFHVRGSSGSHVVLRVGTGKGEPGKKARQQAAGIAAYYSGMKNAQMVPVAMTERKYVRKPRGAPPGTVVIEREKVVFAEPQLPPQESPTSAETGGKRMTAKSPEARR